MCWLFFTASDLAPVEGQAYRSVHYAPVKDALGVRRCVNETLRLYDVRDQASLQQLRCYSTCRFVAARGLTPGPRLPLALHQTLLLNGMQDQAATRRSCYVAQDAVNPTRCM